jgi:hypothetical protein
MAATHRTAVPQPLYTAQLSHRAARGAHARGKPYAPRVCACRNHVFLTLHGTPTPHRYHVFLSYRVFSEARLVRKVYNELKKRQLRGQGYMRVYLDAECIKPGSDWRKQFIDGLTHSLVFVPFISRGALLNMAGEPPMGLTLDDVRADGAHTLPTAPRRSHSAHSPSALTLRPQPIGAHTPPTATRVH